MPLSSPLRKPARPLRALARRAAVAGLSGALLASSVPPAAFAAAPASKLVPVRDAEIEQLIRDYATPIFRAAGLDPKRIQIVLIRDLSFNAFVANGQKMFVNLGALIDSKTPNQLIGVIAHETGHIADGHLASLHEKLETAQTRAVIGMLLGVAVAAAGAATGSNAAAQGGMMAAIAPQDFVRRDLLAYARSQEQAADQAAVKYLTKTGQSARGMIEIFESFASKDMFSSRFQDPYAVSHPMPQERIALLERIAKASPSYNAPDKPDFIQRHALARAKALAFMRDAGAVQRAYPLSDHSLAARYARAISSYRFGDVDAAQKQIDALIAEKPNDPYFWELKGQALLEAGRARAAVSPLRKAVSLDPGAALIRILLAQAMVATNDKALLDQAMSELRQALVHERDSSDAYRQLAIIYGRKNMFPQADVASAQAAFIDGRYSNAREFAERAKKGLPVGSPAWLRADDIATYKSASAKK